MANVWYGGESSRQFSQPVWLYLKAHIERGVSGVSAMRSSGAGECGSAKRGPSKNTGWWTSFLEKAGLRRSSYARRNEPVPFFEARYRSAIRLLTKG